MQRPLLLAVLATIGAASPVFAQESSSTHVKLDNDTVSVTFEPGGAYSMTETIDKTIDDADGAAAAKSDSITVSPPIETGQVAEAWVVQPDGSKVVVPPDAIFTRPANADPNAPGFNSNETITVLYPQLQPGSHTHVRWETTRSRPAAMGFAYVTGPSSGVATGHLEYDMTLSATQPMQWRERGGFHVTDTTEGGVRKIVATLDNPPEIPDENGSVSSLDFQPLFMVSDASSAASIGAHYYQNAKFASDPASVANLAAKIAGDKKGLDAARALYNWVAGNIQYVALYLDPDAGYVPHTATAILERGYGDCKDHVALLQALLTARGIPSEAGLISAGNQYQPLPLPAGLNYNHAIAYLPTYKVWLNPTEPTVPFGALDLSLAGKQVALASPEGAVATTPEASPKTDTYHNDMTMNVDRDGDVNGHGRITMSDPVSINVRVAIASAATPKALMTQLLRVTPEGGYGIYEAPNPRDLTQPFTVKTDWTSPLGIPFAAKGETFSTLPLGPDFQPMSVSRGTLSWGDRVTPFIAGAGDYSWSQTIIMPKGTIINHLPPNQSLSNPAGQYTARYSEDDNVIHVSRHLVVLHDIYSAADYDAVRTLMMTGYNDTRAVAAFTLGAE